MSDYHDRYVRRQIRGHPIRFGLWYYAAKIRLAIIAWWRGPRP